MSLETNSISPGKSEKLVFKNFEPKYFVEGKGTLDKPYQSPPTTLLENSMNDAYHLAMYSGDKASRVYFEHNGFVVGVDKDMQVTLAGKEGENINADFQKLLEQTAQQLRDMGLRSLTPQELQDMRQEYQNRKKLPKPLDRIMSKVVELFDY